MATVEVLLREHVKDLGKCGDVVKVKAGYARNYLLPKRIATYATEEEKKMMMRRRVRLDAEEVAHPVAQRRSARERLARSRSRCSLSRSSHSRWRRASSAANERERSSRAPCTNQTGRGELAAIA